MIITAPLSVPQNKSKNFCLNLNVYRNAHYHTLNTVKKRYKEALREQINKLPVMTKVSLVYTLFPKTKRLCDISNVLSIHDKFFCDALVELGKLPDDNYLYLAQVSYLFGKIDRLNSRVEIQIFSGDTNEYHFKQH